MVGVAGGTVQAQTLDDLRTNIGAYYKFTEDTDIAIRLSLDERVWLLGGMAKVCLQVGSEQALLDHHEAALRRGLKSFLIRDSGRTEFAGTPTLTACAIGPAPVSRIDAVTGDLPLY